jgi:hypothetical protein
MPRRPAGVSTSVPAVARPGLSAFQAQELQRQIAAGLLNPCRRRVMGYAGADDRQLLLALLERAGKDVRFCTALAYVVSTRDVLVFETVLDHPERPLPLGIEMWAERNAEAARSAPSARAHQRAGAPAGSAIALIIGGVLGIVAGWILLSVTGATNTLCNTLLGELAQESGVSTGQCTAAAIGNGIGLTLVIVGVLTLLSGFLTMIVRQSRSPMR